MDNFVDNAILSRFFQKKMWITLFFAIHKILQISHSLYNLYKYYATQYFFKKSVDKLSVFVYIAIIVTIIIIT